MRIFSLCHFFLFFGLLIITSSNTKISEKVSEIKLEGIMMINFFGAQI